MRRLGVLLSGRGSNFVAIADAIAAGRIAGAEIAVVLSNKADAGGLEAARARGLTAIAVPSKGMPREAHDAEMMRLLREHRVDLVCLAGYLRIVGPEFVRAFPEGILNVHPALLPAFPGLDAQRQALEYGVKVAGCTLHFVDEAVDHGVIVVQRVVPVEDRDTEATLSARILVEEHAAYVEGIRRVLSGEYGTVGRRYMRVGR